MKKKFLFAAFLICGAISSVAEEKPKYKDASLPVEERVEDLLRRMTLHEKVLQLQNNSTSDINAIENTYKGGSPGSVHEMSKSAKEAALLFNKMQEYLLTQNRLGIPALVTVEGINGVTQNGCTIFPQAIAQGSTFNPELVEEMSRAIGRESHVIGIRQLQCPVLDIARDLRWGRVEETFGEDPFLIGEMGTAFVRGSQAEGVGAMPKHFVAHGTPTGGLNCASVPGGERELRNLYAYPFANVYHRRTEDLLFKDQKIPSSTGFGSVSYVNAGTMDNDGWELEFSTNNMVKRGDWTLDLSLNFSNYVNTIIELDENVLNNYNPDFNYTNGGYLTRLQINNSFGSIYGFRYKGVYQYDKYQPDNPDATAPVVRDENGNVVLDGKGETIPMYFAYGTSNAYRFRGGDAIYEDINHDGTIDELDIVYLGNSNPKFDGGFGATLRWKRLTLNMFFNYRVGGKIINYGRMDAENMYSTNNQSIATNWRWRKDGDMTEIPRALYQYGYNYLGSDRFVEDGSFLRFKQLTLSYSFDPKMLKKAHLNTLNLSLTLNNLLTVTKYTGADPEISPNNIGVSEDKNRTPRSRYFTFGLTVGI